MMRKRRCGVVMRVGLEEIVLAAACLSIFVDVFLFCLFYRVLS